MKVGEIGGLLYFYTEGSLGKGKRKRKGKGNIPQTKIHHPPLNQWQLKDEDGFFSKGCLTLRPQAIIPCRNSNNSSLFNADPGIQHRKFFH
jgi:hypothetical protein